jgi:hypothetical protein
VNVDKEEEEDVWLRASNDLSKSRSRIDADAPGFELMRSILSGFSGFSGRSGRSDRSGRSVLSGCGGCEFGTEAEDVEDEEGIDDDASPLI